jgi:hypothetical protein
MLVIRWRSDCTFLCEPTNEGCCLAQACLLRTACHERIYATEVEEKRIHNQNYSRVS